MVGKEEVGGPVDLSALNSATGLTNRKHWEVECDASDLNCILKMRK